MRPVELSELWRGGRIRRAVQQEAGDLETRPSSLSSTSRERHRVTVACALSPRKEMETSSC